MSRYRVEAVASALERVGAGVVVALEELDPQYWAARRVSEALGPGPAAVALALAAVTAYRLAMTGEEYWECFADHAARWASWHGPPRTPTEAAAMVSSFLRSCPGARVQREAKERRVARAAQGAQRALAELAEARGPRDLAVLAGRLRRALASALGQPDTAKTIVFAVKMAYYALRPPGLGDPVDIDVEMPVDVRVACASYASGMVEARGYREIVSTPAPAQEAWRAASKLSRIPLVHLDALAWLSGARIRDDPDPAGSIALMLVQAGARPGDARRLAAELAWRQCRA